MGHPLLLGWLGAGPGSSAGLSIALGFRAVRLLSLGWPGGEDVWLDGKRMGAAEWLGGALTAVGRPGKPDWNKSRERRCLEIRGRRLLISNGKVSDLSASCTLPPFSHTDLVLTLLLSRRGDGMTCPETAIVRPRPSLEQPPN